MKTDEYTNTNLLNKGKNIRYQVEDSILGIYAEIWLSPSWSDSVYYSQRKEEV